MGGGSTWQPDESGKAGPATAAPTGAAYGGGWKAAENGGGWKATQNGGSWKAAENGVSWKATQNGGSWKAAEHGGGWKKASKKDRVMDDWFSQQMAMAH